MKVIRLNFVLFLQSLTGLYLDAATLILDEQLFLGALEGEPQLESFENEGRIFGLREFDFENVRVSNFGNPFSFRWAINNARQSIFPLDGDFYLQYGGRFDDVLLFEFEVPIIAFGVYIFDYGDETNRSLDFIPNEGQVLSWFPDFEENDFPLRFVGYLGDTPFTSLGLLQNDDESYLLDSLYFLPVPEPSSALLLASALPLLLRRKRTCRP